IDSPGGPMIVGVGIDISARVRAEKALAASEHNYRELFNATHDGIFIHDEAGRVLDVNERGCAMFGFDASFARGSPLVELSPGEPPYSQRDAIEKLRLAASEGPQVFEWQSRRLGRTMFWSEIALRAFRIEGEVRVIASVRDITDRKLAELERERLMAELQAASSAKDQFMAVLSHELRNPLAAIQASIDLLLHLPTLDEPRALSALRIMERNVKLQTRLVNDLLDLSRLMRGKLTIERAPVRLGEVVLSAAETCRADAVRAEVSLETRAEPGLWVNADATRLQQMIINLVDNAIKFTPKRGRVTVSVTATEGLGYVVVEDTGVGIAPDRLSDIFEMFRQGEAVAHRAPGLGIGLALVKSIADLHGSRVWAESAGPGRGSRFIVELPLYEAPAAGIAHKVSTSGRAVLKVLLVEDNTDTRTMLAETLAQLDYLVIPVESAEAALEVLAHEPVDVILADMGLPGIDGYDFLRQARRLPFAAHVPALALTGYGQESDVRRAREAGYVAHFVKPATIEIIDQQIRARVGSADDDAQ
ncbi:MAG TPA: ATP-binding protein, partial [Kofleriaceae bacterium]